MWYIVRNLRCTVTIDSVLANSKTQNAFLFTMHAIFRHGYPLAVEPASTPRPLVQKKTLRDSLPIDTLLSAMYVLVVAQSGSEFPEGLMNNPVYTTLHMVSYRFYFKLQKFSFSSEDTGTGSCTCTCTHLLSKQCHKPHSHHFVTFSMEHKGQMTQWTTWSNLVLTFASTARCWF